MLGSDYRGFKLRLQCTLRHAHTYKMWKQTNLWKVSAEDATNHFTWSHGEADVNIMETDVVQQLVNVIAFTSEVKQKAT